jgi:hypothetical protein
MTVEDEHVYRVSMLGALVHNNCPGEGPVDPNDTWVDDGDGTWLENPPKTLPSGPGQIFNPETGEWEFPEGWEM